jgi:hypothetical protein
MNNFPILCVDGFYKDPDKIRDFALRQKYYHSDGRYPGIRTESLHILDRDLFDSCCEKFFSLFYDNKDNLKWEVSTIFEINHYYNDDENSYFNKGFIHSDCSYELVGIVFLSPNIKKESGVSIFEEKNSSLKKYTDAENLEIRKKYYLEKKDEGYGNLFQNMYSDFEKTIEFSNLYNRIICFPGETIHATSSFHTTEIRLNQLFFVKTVTSDFGYPLARCDKDI